MEVSQNNRSIKCNIWGTEDKKPSQLLPRVPQDGMGEIGEIGPISTISAEDPKYAKIAQVSLHFDASTARIHFVDETELQDACKFSWKVIMMRTQNAYQGSQSQPPADPAPGVPDPEGPTPGDFFSAFA